MSALTFGYILTFIIALSIPVGGYLLYLRLEAKRQRELEQQASLTAAQATSKAASKTASEATN